jgi:hypothetical protein
VQHGFAGAIASSSGSQLYRTVRVDSSAVNIFYRPSVYSPRAALETRSQATQTEDVYIASGIRHPDQPPAFDSFPPDISMDGAYGLEIPAGCTRLNAPSLAQAYAASQQRMTGEQLLRSHQQMWEQLQCAPLIPLSRVFFCVCHQHSAGRKYVVKMLRVREVMQFLSLTGTGSSPRDSVSESPGNDKIRLACRSNCPHEWRGKFCCRMPRC